jgi:predicted nucleic acid-binding protein
MDIVKFANARISGAVRLYAAGNMDFIDACNIAYIRSKDHSKIAAFDSRHYK